MNSRLDLIARNRVLLNKANFNLLYWRAYWRHANQYIHIIWIQVRNHLHIWNYTTRGPYIWSGKFSKYFNTRNKLEIPNLSVYICYIQLLPFSVWNSCFNMKTIQKLFRSILNVQALQVFKLLRSECAV